MGETFKQEFRFGQVPVGSADDNAGFIPAYIGQHIQTRPTALSQFFMNLGPALQGALGASQGPEGGFATGLAGGLGGIQQQQDRQALLGENRNQRLFENILRQRQDKREQERLELTQGQSESVNISGKLFGLDEDFTVPRGDLSSILINLGSRQKPLEEIKQRTTIADAMQLTGDERMRYILTGQIAADKSPKTVTTKEGVFILKEDGSLGPRLGSPALQDPQDKPPQEGERKAAYHYNNAFDSQQSADLFEDSVVGLMGQLQTKYAPNLMKDEDVQKYNQAADRWMRAVGFFESGAQIPPAEMEAGKKIYFAQPGDTPETVAQKRQKRLNTMENMKQAAGRGVKSGGGVKIKRDKNGRIIGIE